MHRTAAHAFLRLQFVTHIAALADADEQAAGENMPGMVIAVMAQEIPTHVAIWTRLRSGSNRQRVPNLIQDLLEQSKRFGSIIP